MILEGPIHYWSFNGDLRRDEIGGAHLLNPVNAYLHSAEENDANDPLHHQLSPLGCCADILIYCFGM